MRRREVALVPVHLGVLGLRYGTFLFARVGRDLLRRELLGVRRQAKVKLASINVFVGLQTQIQEGLSSELG